MAGTLENLLRRPGTFVHRQYRLIVELAVLCFRTVRGFRSLFSPAGMQIFLRQLYFTAVQPAPLVIVGALFLGAFLVHYIINFFTSLGARDEIGRFILFVIVNELSSVFVAVIVMIRSGSAIISELALMKLNNELDTLRILDISMYDYLFFPRVCAVVISNMLLAALFCLVALLGGFISFGYINNTPFYEYIERMASSTVVMDFITIYVKSMLFGFVIVLVSIRDGLSVKHSISEVPVRLIHGLVVQVMFILFIELIYDVIRYGDFL
jgi:phospholipid/cholesterol/gamma-HCH transport system permease protein